MTAQSNLFPVDPEENGIDFFAPGYEQTMLLHQMAYVLELVLERLVKRFCDQDDFDKSVFLAANAALKEYATQYERPEKPPNPVLPQPRTANQPA